MRTGSGSDACGCYARRCGLEHERVVLAAAILFPTGIAPQPEPLGTAWWVLRPPWLIACAICLVPFLLAFRWAERPTAEAGDAGPHPGDLVLTLLGTAAAAAGLGILASEAFPVPDEVVAVPAIGVALVVAAAALLRVDPVAPLRARALDASGR